MRLSPRFCTDFPMSSTTLQLNLSLSCATAEGVWLVPDLLFQALLSVPPASAWLHVTSDHSVATSESWHNSSDVTVAADGVVTLSVYITVPGSGAINVAVSTLSAYSSPVVVPPPGWSFVPDVSDETLLSEYYDVQPSTSESITVSGRLRTPSNGGTASSNT